MDSYIEVAMLPTAPIQKNVKGHSFSGNKLNLDVCLSGGRRGKKSASFAHAPTVVSKPPPIRPDARYGDGTEDPIGTERVVGFEPTFDLTTSGLHRPKIVVCLGSKGGRFKQLVKGEDDLRQDAIMQQVFGTVNDLLRNEDSIGGDFIHKSVGASFIKDSSRQLRLITYGITPLSPVSGVLEWVDNTMGFGEFMQDKGKKVGASSKYFPGEWGNSACHAFYKDNFDSSHEHRREVFDIICKNRSPGAIAGGRLLSLVQSSASNVASPFISTVVFRFFFLEYFSTSMEAWHTARTLYTKSCAVNSIGKST